MDRYAVTGRDNAVAASPGTTALSANGVTTTRATVYDFIVSTGGTPADNAIQWLAQRFTASGTGTGVTPAEIDLDGPAALLTFEENHTIEPTYTAGGELWDNFVHQRATFRWVAAPEGGLRIPATSDAGIGWRAFHASYTGSAEVTMHYAE